MHTFGFRKKKSTQIQKHKRVFINRHVWEKGAGRKGKGGNTEEKRKTKSHPSFPLFHQNSQDLK